MSDIKQSLPDDPRNTSPESLAPASMGSFNETPLDTSSGPSTGELNSAATINSQEPSSSAPAGIDEAVLVKINAFLEQTEPIRPGISQRSSSNQMEAWRKNSTATTFDQPEPKIHEARQGMKTSAIKDEEDFDFDPDEFHLPPSGSSSDGYEESSGKDALQSQEESSTSSLPQEHMYQVADPEAPKIIARYIYSSGRTPPPLSPREPVPTLSLVSLLAIFWSYILSFILHNEPDIIEYSPQEIKYRAGDIAVEAQIVEFPVQPEKVVGVVALLHVGAGEHRWALPITAKPKRVRELMTEEVGKLAEDVYGKEIKGALKALQKMVD
ncbi:hypothetical protein DE146DRAFT_641752 [Phaeosphaeria sp. MPI-PUGE-AT-0046c]|nr:hypothetical protein DE146DRAFT_641752 [Phaeosphaeria sp. MPI-PUGE-AT-0046c]